MPSRAQHDELSSKQVWAALKQSVITHFGDAGWGAVGSSLTSTSTSSASDPISFATKLTRTGPAVKYFSPKTNLCIIRVARDPHKLAWASVTLITAIDGRRYVPHVVHVSGASPALGPPYRCVRGGAERLHTGTIKQAQLSAIRHNREVVARYRARAKTPGSRSDLTFES